MEQPREPQGTPKGGQFAHNPYATTDEDLEDWNVGEYQKSLGTQPIRLWSDPQVRELGFEKRELAEGLEWLAKTPEWDETETIRHLDEASYAEVELAYML